MAQQQRIPERVAQLHMLGTTGEEFHPQLPELCQSRISVQGAVVHGRKTVDILVDEIGDVEARVNEERITQDDFARAGGAADSLCTLEVLLLVLGGSMRLEKGLLLFVRGDPAVLDEVLLVAVRIQALRELRFLSLA